MDNPTPHEGYRQAPERCAVCGGEAYGRCGRCGRTFCLEHFTTSDEQRCPKLLNEMKGKSHRKAAFECVISIAVPSGPALTYEARCEGLITETPAGNNGFGYDPIFYYPPLKKTFAEMSREEKGRVSHRGKALRELRDEFEKVLVWIQRQIVF